MRHDAGGAGGVVAHRRPREGRRRRQHTSAEQRGSQCHDESHPITLPHPKKTEKKILLLREDHLNHIAVGPGWHWNLTPPGCLTKKHLRILRATEAGVG
jgi:hypothetical protein